MPRYIHERPDWPDFSWDINALAGPLLAASRAQSRLLGRMQALGLPVRAQAALEIFTTDVIKSSEIEGEVLNEDVVRSSVARHMGVDIGALMPADRHVEGVVAMTLDATQKWRAPLSVKRLFGWQAGLFPGGRSGLRKITIGDWRHDKTGPMQVVSGTPGRERVHFEAPPAKRVGKEMERFLKWFNADSEMDAVLKAGLAHLWFVTIHPFEDGNGRIARAISDMMLARAEQTPERFYSLSAQIRRERKDYYAILEATQKGGLDVTPWLEWFLACLDRAIGNADTILSGVLDKTRFWERHRHADFNARQQLVLNRLFDGFAGALTSSKWAKLAKCSQDTAGRDIDDLLRRGILMRNPGGGRSTSYALNRNG